MVERASAVEISDEIPDTRPLQDGDNLGSDGLKLPSGTTTYSCNSPLPLSGKQLTSVSGTDPILKCPPKPVGDVALPAKSLSQMPSQNDKDLWPTGVKYKLAACSKSSVDEDELSEEPFVGPSVRWPSQPKSYRGAKLRETGLLRKNVRKVSIDFTKKGN